MSKISDWDKGRLFGECARCGQSFQPEWTEALSCFTRCCPECQIRNLAENLELPELLEAAGLKPKPVPTIPPHHAKS